MMIFYRPKKVETFKKILCVFLFFFSMVINAQNINVKGQIIDNKTKEPLPGVSILIKGTKIGVTSEFDGTYSIKSEKEAVLVFSYLGYTTKEVKVTATTLNVILEESAESLDEIVLIGYGSSKKKDLTGSVASISAKDFQNVPVTNVEDLIANKLPGVQITPSSGKPGAGSSILIRGGSSLSATNDPLFIIDGLPVEGANGGPGVLSQLNPNDIESFSVLKDASASAIYGSRASNGVVIITTKKGSLTGFKMSVSSSTRVSTILRNADVLTADQYRTVIQGLGTSITPVGNANTDWQDEIFQPAFTQEHNISMSGAIKSLPYRVSVGFLNQDGNLKTGNYKRTTALLNLSPKFFDNHLKVNLNLKGSFEDERIANENAIWTATAFDPTQPVHVEDQTYGGYFQYIQFASNPALGLTNPVSMLEQNNKRNQNLRSIGNLQLDYKFHFFPDLHVNVNAGYDISKATFRDAVESTYFPNDNSGGYIYYASPAREIQNVLFESYLFYSKELESIKSKIDFTGGYSYNNFLRTNYFYPTFRADTGAQFPNSDPPFPFDKPSNAIISFYGRLNYNYDSKYLLTASIRRDGSSRFAENNRWGIFPSVALGWRISEESFLEDNSVVSNLKLRASYGVTGQQDFDVEKNPEYNYYFQQGYNTGSLNNQYTFGDTTYTTISPQAFNPDLKWEQTASFNIGLDFGFIDNRISGSIDVYQKDTKDLINLTTIPLGVNFNNQLLLNIGTMQNRGVEFNLNAIPVQTENLTWNLNFNATFNENKITKLTNGNDDGVGLFSDATLVNTVGFPRNTFYLYHQVYDGNGMPIEGQMLDVNEDGNINAEDRYITNKSTLPKYLLGFSTNLQYKKWSFSTSFHANLDHYLYFQPYNSTVAITGFQVSQNLNQLYYDTRFKFNDDAQRFSDFYLQNASFLKMDNLNIGYNFGKTLLNSKLGLDLNFSVQNVFVITNYDGIDPEASGGYENAYPIPRIYALGVNLNF
ncbi:TonB-dependent receptor [Polaribacter sp. Hel1_33_78]|uniref:SusC/RagA family TonB-linked outer membrane protein n=1 Tax=Polaribacter sp. Hel1_33_78 TaxID=1336804 RepID=UPI000B883592|nr:TonB-dependent receptor [Polaribacter sp. Hel1_33_78]